MSETEMSNHRVLGKFDASRRRFLRRVLATSAFALPFVVTFANDTSTFGFDAARTQDVIYYS